ncbi:diflavin oxidoreductase [Poseidonocella sedimentorum]|uniref:assimilatory sulfite reductase (NADPH) n=1 Tax=Poseidonocella sedimentorum TaxID=871652 RepID=A0A1I6DQC5_9RHOB|nr:flavodoxin domain-containing protein [Poseidonocella sedimentorum]SFR07581.1 sulfite reductase (NADPH) flavoprotein alpha-component [Poseidonocella sedimentorum]
MTRPETGILDKLAFAIGQTETARAPQFLPEDAPFEADQRHWLNGLLTGLNAIAQASAGTGAEAAPGTALTVLYGSQSGTCESLAKDLRKFAKTQGFEASVADLDSVEISDLAAINHLLILAATTGEGEPTDNARGFYKALLAEDAPALPETLNFSVCGLGDSSYALFNKAAVDIDARLGELGATRVQDLVACDVAYEDDYGAWKEAVFQTEPFASAAGAASAPAPEAGPAFDKNHPFLATLLEVRCLNVEGSAKTVNHVEISLAGGGEDLDYAVGDALGLWPINCPEEVRAILAATGFTGAEPIMLKTGPSGLRAALLTRLDLTTATPATREAWGGAEMEAPQVIDLLRAGVEGMTPQMLVDGLRPLQPRLYSISSSPRKHPGEVHLTVGEVHYDLHGSARKGCASTYLGQRLTPGATVGVYIQRSAHFHAPADDASPLIMIGPGTGIAPFRAFLEEREMRGATGPNWLFFGDQHEATDYLYRDEIADWQVSGLLTRASLAWSRDGAEKVYVQHLIKREGAEFFGWLESGGAIYICGDATRMAADVEAAILAVIAEHGKMDAEAARVYLDVLAKSHRYQRDVY